MSEWPARYITPGMLMDLRAPQTILLLMISGVYHLEAGLIGDFGGGDRANEHASRIHSPHMNADRGGRARELDMATRYNRFGVSVMEKEPINAPVKTQMNRVHIIVNPAAGREEPVLSVLNRIFAPAKVDWDVFITKKAGDARAFAQQAVSAEVDAVAVYGGDGTVTEVASGLMGSQMPLAILPGGTANVTSIELGIPARLDEAVGLICVAHSYRWMDMGQVGDRLFLGHVGIGLEANMHETADRSMKDQLGFLAYPIAALQALREPPLSHYTLTLDGQTVEMDGLNCMVTNLGSIGVLGATLSADISVSDGLLDVIVIRNADVSSVAALAAKVTGLGNPSEQLPHWQVREATIVADPAQGITADGEVLGQTPVNIKVLPHMVKIIVPASAAPKTASD
ncbi:MAG TPA: diacylglycerol kinase family protein [Anaerolineae bacterium]